MKRVRVVDIIAVASQLSHHTAGDILSRARHKPLVLTRFAIYTVARENGHSYPVIGKILGRDHSTVLHGCKVCEIFARDRPSFGKFLADLREATADLTPFDVKPLRKASDDAEPLQYPRLMMIKPPKPRNVFSVSSFDALEAHGIEQRNAMRAASRLLAVKINEARAVCA
jgi:Bacterial dnaA protein helix-turn-helix